MGDVMEFDMGNGSGRGRPPPRIASRLAAGRANSGAKSTDGPIRARPPSGREDSKASNIGPVTAKRPNFVTTDSLRSRGGRGMRESTIRGRGSSDDEAVAKPMTRRGGSPQGFRRAGTERRGSFDPRASAAETNNFRLGQKIEGRYRGKGRWYKGRVIGVNPGGTYDVRYEDGDEDLGLEASAIKSAGNPLAKTPSSSAVAVHGRGNSGGGRIPRIGDRVEAKAPGMARWQRATVVGENRDGTLDVRFGNGKEEKHLDPSSMREREDVDDNRRNQMSDNAIGQRKVSGRGETEAFRVGDDIEARYRGKSKWFKGVIRRDNSDSTYDIRYADGDEEMGVDSSLVRSLDGAGRGRGAGGASDRKSPSLGRGGGSYRVGDKVEARFGGRTRWFKATVERENRDGTYHLLYADGDEERAVDRTLIRNDETAVTRSRSKSPGRRVISGASSEVDLATHPSFRQGDRVEARYKRGRRWYVGIIQTVDRDGTYDIRYEDGDTEVNVDPGLVRGIGVSSEDSLGSAAAGAKTGGGAEGDVLEGDKVEARFGGRSRWFKATVQRKNRDRTYHLLYDDGDEERSVEKAMIRRTREPEWRDDKATSSGQGPSSSRANSYPDSGNTATGTRKQSLRVGDEIEARYKSGRKWYPGVIRAANRTGTYDIRYEDGETEHDVEPSLVRGKSNTSIDSLDSSDIGEGAAENVGFSRGEKVEARFGGRARWFKATVEKKNRDGTFHLLYIDGDEERAVDRGLIRRVDGATKVVSKSRSPGNRAKGEVESESETKTFHVGDDIEARYKRGMKWYSGVIRAVNRNGTYNIRYKDGDAESDVDATLVRGTGSDSIESLGSSKVGGDKGVGGYFEEGDRVEARFGGRSRWFKATVERRNRDGTYFLIYADGDEERAVATGLIRRHTAAGLGTERSSMVSAARRVMGAGHGSDSEAPSRVTTVRIGDTVEARYKQGHKWYPGVVRAVNRGGTYDIRYKDGDNEYDVDAGFVRVVSVDSLNSDDTDGKRGAGTEYLQGDRVEARYGGRSRWIKGKVLKANRDGTYHLVYVDGEEERAVPKRLMRTFREQDIAQESKGESSAAHRDDGVPNRHRIGDDIEARYKKGRRWYSGVIRAISRDGTYDIRYADGDNERDVQPSLVRSKEGASTASLASADRDVFLEGDKVEARFGGRSRWFKATIERENRDGTYHLSYADGDEEKSVEKHLMRKIGAGGSTGSIKSPGRRVVSGGAESDAGTVKVFRVRDDVEARYKRGRKWFPGAIRAVNRDGTYDIRYKDGDSERNVDPEFVRGTGTDSANSLATTTSTGWDGTDFAVGDKVEARFGGRSRWFKATVERKNRDDTYHLLYADGDEERSVEKNLIRKVGGGGGRSDSKSPGRRVVSGTGAYHEAESVVEARLLEGDEVEARYKGGRKWFPGVIRTVNRDGTYDVQYKDGDREHSVDRGLIRGKDARSIDSLSSGVDIRTTRDEIFVVSDEVEARFRGRSRWLKATVERKNRDGTYHLLYADGDEERSVDKYLIRRINTQDNRVSGRSSADQQRAHRQINSVDSLASSASGYHRMGDKVEARFGGRSRWFKATVERENLDGTYTLLYDDGDKERAVHKDMIRSLVNQRRSGEEAKDGREKTDSRSSRPGSKSLAAEVHRVGDDVEARYKRGRKWYKGVIQGVTRDGTYDIRYNDGDTERDVDGALVRRIASTSTESLENRRFGVRENVEARFGGRSRWFKATVERSNRDGTYHLLYADGDEEKRVGNDLMRKVGGGGVGGGREQQPRDIRSVAKRALSGGGGSSDSNADMNEQKRDGDYGDRPPSRKSSPKRDAPMQVGDKIEARYRRGSRWLPGRISRAHRNGCYDISYSDGDSERDVPANLVRPAGIGGDKGGRGSSGTSDSDIDGRSRGVDNKQNRKEDLIIVGDHVEARFRGRSTWQEGEVTRVHSDGTYDVCYSDGGEKEKRVDPRMVRLQRNMGSAKRGIKSSRRQSGESSSGTEDSLRGKDNRGRSKERRSTTRGDPIVSEDAKAAAARVRRALGTSGKSVDYLTSKLERAQRAVSQRGRKDSRGRSIAGGGIDRDALDMVLTGISVELSSREFRALSRCCEDVENDGCVDPSALTSLVQGRSRGLNSGSADFKRLSSGSRGRRGRHSSSSASGDSDGEVAARQPSHGANRPRRRPTHNSRSGGSSNSDAELRGRRRSQSSTRGSRNGDRSSSTRHQGKEDRRISTGSESERGRGGSASSEGRGSRARGGVIGKRGLRALLKLEGPAFDGSLRGEFEKLSGGQGRGLPASKLSRLLQRLRVTLEEPALGDITTILDLQDDQYISRQSLLEAALSAVEQKKIAKIHTVICKQLLAPSGKGSKRQQRKGVKDAVAAVSNTLAKMEHPKNSGLLPTRHLDKLLQKLDVSTLSGDIEALSKRLDPDDRGRVDREAFVLWLTSGFDLRQAESRASRQLLLFKSRIPKPGKAFREFDSDRQGAVTKSDFALAMGRLGLVLTHGQMARLAAEHHIDYKRFIARLGRSREETSEGSDSESTAAGRRSSSRTSKRSRKSHDSSADSDQSPVSGASDREEGGGGKVGLLLGNNARAALHDAFERACSSTGGIRETFRSVVSRDGRGANQSIGETLADREQMKRFLRRLKLGLSDVDRGVVLNCLVGPCDDDKGKKRGVSFERDGEKRRSAGRGKGGHSDEGRHGDDCDGSGRVSYRDFLELLLSEQESKELSKVHGRMSKDLATIAGRKKTCAFALTVKALSSYDTEGLGFVKVSEFKRGLEKLGVGGLSSAEKSLLVRRFDPLEEGMVGCEMFGAWLSSGIDPDRLTEKLGRLLCQLTGRGSGADRGGQGEAKGRARGGGKRPKGGVRGVFEAIDKGSEGTVSQHEMKVTLRKTLGLPLTEGDMRALLKRLDKDGDGMLDYEELLVLSSRKNRGRDGDNDGGRGILSKLRRKGSALINGSRGQPGSSDEDDNKTDGTNITGQNADTDDEEDGEDDDDENENGSKRRGRDKKKRKKDKRKDRGRKEGGVNGRSSPSKGVRLERELMRLRASILQQAATAEARGREDDEEEPSDEERKGISSSGTVDWVGMFEGRDRAGTGKATVDNLEHVLKEGGVRVSRDDLAILVKRFGTTEDLDEKTKEGEEDGSSSGKGGPTVDYDALVQWLSEGGGLDDALLSKVQRHLKARLSKAMDLRALFTEMCSGNSNKLSSSKRNSSKECLSGSRLARGLRHAGLPLDRTVVDQLIAAFSSGRGGGKGRSRLSYADFHKMVHCSGLAAGGAELTGLELEGGGSGGYAGRVGTLDEQIRSTLLEVVERAFAFYDEDNSNSIDAVELGNILRALGHDPTRGEARALLRKADAERNGLLQYEDFQEAVMPFLLERARAKRLTEGEMRSIFDEIDTSRSGAVGRPEFVYTFCGKLGLLSQEEAEAVLSVLDRHQTGEVSWEEFLRLFELMDDGAEAEGAAVLNADLKEVVAVALRKLAMGVMPNVEEQLLSFMGMPSTCRKSVLAPLDHIKELGLQWVLMPKLDSRGCIQLQDMSVKVTTEVAEVEANKAPPDAQGQVLVKTANLADRGSHKNKKPPTRSFASTLGFGKRDTSPPPAVTESRGTKTRRRSSILGMGLVETTTTVMKRAELQEVGASTEEGERGRGGREDGSGGVLQVELSVKHAYGIPVARDSRMRDLRQRGMRACLFYDAGSEVDRDTGKATSEYGEHFLCNTYKTLAVQHPQKEEQWLFPDSSEGERKFLVRTDFGSTNNNNNNNNNSRNRSARHQNGRQKAGESDSPSPASSRENRNKLFLLVELTCTVQTHTDGGGASDNEYYGDPKGVRRGGGRGNDVRGPLKNFRARSSAETRKGRRGRGRQGRDGTAEGSDDSDGSNSRQNEENSGDSGSASASDSAASSDGGRRRTGGNRHKGNRGRDKRTARNVDDDDDEVDSTTTASTSGSIDNNSNKKGGHSREHRGRGSIAKRENGKSHGRKRSSSAANGRAQQHRGRKKTTRSAPPVKRRLSGRSSKDRRGVRSEGPRGRRHRNSSDSSSGVIDSDGTLSRDNSGEYSSYDDGDSSGRGRSLRKGNGQGEEQARGRRRRGATKTSPDDGRRGATKGWRRGWRNKGSQRDGDAAVARAGGEQEGEDGVVEVEMSCGWVLIPFMELVEAQEVKKVRYKLWGGTPFAKTDINENEVMTRRYGWRAVLKAMKIEGTHKGSEVEIKILPVKTLSKAKQEDIFRLPRNVVLSDTFVSLVRHYREYAANSLAKRSAKGMGNAGFGAGSASSDPVLALFPRLAADTAMMMALKNVWEAEVRKTHVDSKLGATLAAGLAGIGLGATMTAGGLAGATGAARGASLLKAFEKAVMRLWPAFCHINAQRRRAATGGIGAESYEELEGRCKRIREILDTSDSFKSDTPTNSSGGGEGGIPGRRGGGGGGMFSSSSASQEGKVFVAFTLKEVAFDVA